MHSHCANGNSADFLSAALAYARRGWSIIPVTNIGKDKKAACPWKQFQTTRPNELTLRQLFSRPDVSGLAVLLGSASGGIVCRDFDRMDAFKRWALSHTELARMLPTVETCRGRHVYFRGPDGYYEFGDGEYRGDARHYCLLPPSRHPDGPTYTWLVPLPSGELPIIEPARPDFSKPGMKQRRQRRTEKNTDNRADRRKQKQ